MVLFPVALAFVACAPPKPPSEGLQATSGAIRAAEEAGAAERPQAALHLTMARESMTKAEQLIAEEEIPAAHMMLDRARADAELALLIARLESTRAEAVEVQRKVKVLAREASPSAQR
jgi:hypothetical protein